MVVDMHYQPTLSTEMGSFQERIVATDAGSITSIQANESCKFTALLKNRQLLLSLVLYLHNWLLNS